MAIITSDGRGGNGEKRPDKVEERIPSLERNHKHI